VSVLRLLAGTVVLRPYVLVFLLVYLFAAVTKMGWAKTLVFTVVAWAVAFAAEFCSTRTGFPFGLYVYVDATRDRELWLANVPFFDSLSFSFLCYVGFALAVFVYSPLVVGRGDVQVADTRALRTSTRVLLTGAFLTMLLDLVIDPVAVRGERWFLGRIYYYPGGGIHFGVPLSNYAGWFLVALVTIAAFQVLERRGGWSAAGVRHVPYGGLLEPLLYLGIVVFNLSMTFWIGERLLGLVGVLLFAPVVVLFLTHPLNPMRRAGPAELMRHRQDFPASRIAQEVAVKPVVVSLVVLAFLLGAVAPAGALTGREVIDGAQKKNGFSTWRDRILDATMQSYSKTLERTRELTITEQTDPRGEHRTFMEFTGPADLAGALFLHLSPRGEKDQQWLWTPVARKARRLSDAGQDESFFGTDLSYRDLELIVRIQQWTDAEATAGLAPETELDGKHCHVVTLTPKNDEFPYGGYRLWFGSEDLLLWQVEVDDREGHLFKRVHLGHYERIQGYETALESEVANVSYGTHTTFAIRNVRYDTDVPDDTFSVANVQKGH
jgi:putative membrane protein